MVTSTNFALRRLTMKSTNNTIRVAGRAIGQGHAPYVIAEMSANHNGNLETGLRIITEAKDAGADAVKIQTYRPDTITLNCSEPDFQIADGLWAGRTLYELYEWAHTPWDWHAPLFDHARKLGITIFSSPFDHTAVDLLEDLNAPAYKIASFEAIDLPLIRYAASTGKPMIISTGMADAEEIQEAVDAAREGGCRELAILHCVSGYPAPAADYNLHTIPDMIKRYGLVTGLSDHTLDNTTAIVSVGLGASIIEKHFTLDRRGGGPDDSFSLEPKELAALCRDARTAWEALGKVDYGRKSSEQGNVKFRRSLYFVKALKAGEVVTPDAVRSVRPGYGASPKYLDDVIGKRVTCNVAANSPVELHRLV
jgi:N-acetylneuraminate synthase